MSRLNSMKSYIPGYLLGNEVILAILGGEGQEMEQIRTGIDDLLKQFYVETSTDWGLACWEQMLGLSSYAGKPVDQRRSRIIAKLRGIGTITVSLVKNVAESYVYGAVQVTEHPMDYSFNIKFVDGRGVPWNLDDLKAAVEEIKPAHLAVIYEFTYTTWDEVKSILWNGVKTGTWEELKSRELV